MIHKPIARDFGISANQNRVADWLSSSLGGVAERLLLSAVDSLTEGVDVSRHRERRISEICRLISIAQECLGLWLHSTIWVG
jgi:hypothetical protein